MTHGVKASPWICGFPVISPQGTIKRYQFIPLGIVTYLELSEVQFIIHTYISTQLSDVNQLLLVTSSLNSNMQHYPLESPGFSTPALTPFLHKHCKYFSSFRIRIKLQRTAVFTLSDAWILIFINPGMQIIIHGNHLSLKHCPKWTAVQWLRSPFTGHCLTKKKSFIGRRYQSYFWRTSATSSQQIAQTKLSLASEAEAKQQKKE